MSPQEKLASINLLDMAFSFLMSFSDHTHRPFQTLQLLIFEDRDLLIMADYQVDMMLCEANGADDAEELDLED